MAVSGLLFQKLKVRETGGQTNKQARRETDRKHKIMKKRRKKKGQKKGKQNKSDDRWMGGRVETGG